MAGRAGTNGNGLMTGVPTSGGRGGGRAKAAALERRRLAKVAAWSGSEWQRWPHWSWSECKGGRTGAGAAASGKGGTGAVPEGGTAGHSELERCPKVAQLATVERLANRASSSTPRGLPPHWRECRDSNNQPYFWNVLTNETSWIPPEMPQPGGSADSSQSRWRRKTGAEKAADNKRKRKQGGSVVRNAVTAKFIRKLEAKDTLIGQLQAGSKSTGPRRILHSLRPGRRSRVQR